MLGSSCSTTSASRCVRLHRQQHRLNASVPGTGVVSRRIRFRVCTAYQHTCLAVLETNPVGFYQISKILITPCVVLIEHFAYGTRLSRHQSFAVALLILGIALVTITDAQVTSNPLGAAIAAAAILSSAFYQVLAGAKQRELQVNGNQLLHSAMPCAGGGLSSLAL